MTREIVVTPADVEAFRAAPGNPNLIYDGTAVWVVPEAVMTGNHPGVFVIISMDDLIEIDPVSQHYAPETLAEILTEFGDERYADTRAEGK